ncbi:MAG: glycosyltransferase, partial [Planctomycetota bacterium]
MSARFLPALLILATSALAASPEEDYAALLGKVVKRGGVDYATLKKGRKALDAYVESIEKALPRKPGISFWINAYNALTLQQVLDTRPAMGSYSVKEVSGFWTKRRWTVAGRKVTLDGIEHKILRKEFREPRIHFAVNCASRSCPPLRAELYVEKTLDRVLTESTRAYMADKEQNRFDLRSRKAEISMLFKWFRGDFERGRKGAVPALQLFLAKYLSDETLAHSLRTTRWSIRFLDYDWSLNDPAAAQKKARGLVHPLFLLLYGLAVLGLLTYGFHAFKLLWWRRRHGRRYLDELAAARAHSPLGRSVFPKVLVQIPVFNEAGVVERVIDAVCALDYPHDRLQIQVLDDSNDKTAAIADRAVARQRRAGLDIAVLRRAHREGFKAGALAHGLERSHAEYVAVFDADFTPPAGFLRQALPLFDMRGEVACVQGRWEHLNRSQNWLTRAQAVGVDAHFFVQQFARAAAGRFLNFNGTAGMWRRSAIDAAGGWRGDTLTEDLDLSYRVQLSGARIVFDPHLVAPAELPPTVGAYKSQQRRWACGSIQCARKYLGPV